MPDRDAPRESDTPTSDRSTPASGEAPIAAEQGGGAEEAGVRAGGTGPGGAESGAAVEADDSDPGEDGEAPVFLNRAARRARGKGGAAPQQSTSRGANPPGRGPAQSRRQWGNRRTGG